MRGSQIQDWKTYLEESAPVMGYIVRLTLDRVSAVVENKRGERRASKGTELNQRKQDFAGLDRKPQRDDTRRVWFLAPHLFLPL